MILQNIRILITLSLLMTMAFNSQAQIELPDKQAVSDLMIGTWELTEHYYSIAGIQDLYPTEYSSHHLVIEQGANDSTLVVNSYRNNCPLDEQTMIIAEGNFGFEWQLSNFPQVLHRDWWTTPTRFIVYQGESTQDKIFLSMGAADGSTFTFERRPDGITPNEDCFAPENFEFLDHSQRASRAGVTNTINEGVVYVSHNGFTPMTTVNLAGYDQTLTNLYESEFFSSESKIYETNDSTYQIILYNLWDYDVNGPGFIELSFSGDKVEVNHIFDGSNGSYLAISDVVKVPSGWWATNYESMIKIEGEEIVQEIEPSPADKLYVNQQGQVYGYSESWTEMPTIDIFDGTAMTEVLSFSQRLFGIKEFRSDNYVLLEGELRQYNLDFSTLVNSWSIPREVTNINQLDLSDNYHSIAYSTEVKNEILRCDDVGDCKTVYTSEEKTETLTGLTSLVDSSYLVTGVYDFENLTNQVFFRSVPVTYEPDYEKSDMDMRNFDIEALEVDTIDFYISSSSGDTIWNITQDFRVEAGVENPGQNTVQVTDTYSSAFWIGGFGPFPNFLSFDFDAALDPGLWQSQWNVYENRPGDYTDLVMGIPGADYRFNEGAKRIIPVDYTTGLHEILNQEAISRIQIYPNPASDNIYIDGRPEIDQVSIYDMAGKLIKQLYEIDASQRVPIKELENGVYHVLVRSKYGQLSSATFIKLD